MEVFILDPSRLISDVVAHTAELKSLYQKSESPITDDEITLQKLCVKLETVLRHEQKEKYSLLGLRRDYWNFIAEGIPKDDGIKYVNGNPQLRTAQGKGRAYIRFCLVKKTLADSIQRCLVDKKLLGSWYKPGAILRNNSLANALVNKLYDLNDVEFDLSSSGHDLDISWPAFSRRSFGEDSVSGRRSSVSSMTSVDYRNERTDPLLALSTEISALKDLFAHESPLAMGTGDGETFDTVSIPDSTAVDLPSISEMTLDLSRIHQQILKWKSEMESRVLKVNHALKKAEDDKKYAIQESELRVKQLHEQQVQLSIISAEKSNAKTKELVGRLSESENALHERDAEIKQLREDINNAVSSSHEAQRSAIDLEKQLTVSLRVQNEISSENVSLKERLKTAVETKEELEHKIQEYKIRISDFEAKETEQKEKIFKVQGDLKAKEVTLKTVQESFEKLNGMVFGSFEELEKELKSRLLEREKGLESKSAENRQLELGIVEQQQLNRELKQKLSETDLRLQQLENTCEEALGREKEMKTKLTIAQSNLEVLDSVVLQIKEVFNGVADEEKEIITDNGRHSDVVEHSRQLVSVLGVTRDQLKNEKSQNSELAKKFHTLEEKVEEKDVEIERLVEEARSMKQQLESFTLQKGQLDEINIEYTSLQENLRAVTKEKKEADEEMLLLKNHNEEERAQFRHEFENQLFQLKQELDQSCTLRVNLESKVNDMKEEIYELCSQNDELREKLDSVREEMSSLQDEKASLELELSDSRQLLEAANEGRILAEQGQAKARGQLENVKCTLEQEIAALKFQLSSETMKFETEIKVLSDQTHESAGLKEKLGEREEMITELENRLKERNDAWQNDRLKYSNEIKHLRNEVQNYKTNYDTYKQKVVSMENELVLMRRMLDEEKAKGRDMKRMVEDVEQQKLNSEKKLNQKMAEILQDMKELKERLITVTREKSQLWLKADDMEHCVTLKVQDRWIEDKEVTHCTGCNAEFTLFLRRHHCRECGRIFCYSCSNNWIRTPHSRKLKRVCNNCIVTDRKLKEFLVKTKGQKSGSVDEDFDDTRSDTSESTRGNSSFLSQGENDLPFPAEDDRSQRFSADRNESTHSFRGQECERNLSNGPKASSSPKQERPSKKGQQSETLTRDSSAVTAVAQPGSNVSGRSNRPVSGYESPQSQTSNDSEPFEIISTNEDDIEECSGTMVLITDRDIRAELLEPVMNESQGQFKEVTIPAATRYVVPVAVRNSGSTICWKFSTAVKSISFGVGFTDSENKKWSQCETLISMARHQSHTVPVEGEIQVLTPGVILLVFDNSFARLTTKRLFYLVQLMGNDAKIVGKPHLR